MVPQLHMHHICRFRNDIMLAKASLGASSKRAAYTKAQTATVISRI